MNRLRELRKEAKLTQEALATDVGVSKRTIISWEKAEKLSLKTEKAEQIAAYFGVSVSYLLGDSANRYELGHIGKAIRDKAAELGVPVDNKALKQTLAYSEIAAFWSLDLKVIQQIYFYYSENESELLLLKEVLEAISRNIENEIKGDLKTLSIAEAHQAQEILDELTFLGVIQDKIESYLNSITDWEKKTVGISSFDRWYRDQIDFAKTNDIAKQIDSIIHNEGLEEFLYNFDKVFVLIENKEKYSDEEIEALDRLDHKILALIDMMFDKRLRIQKRLLIQKLKRD